MAASCDNQAAAAAAVSSRPVVDWTKSVKYSALETRTADADEAVAV